MLKSMEHQQLSIIPSSCVLRVKLLKLHCTHAGFIRAGALYGQTIKGIETRSKSSAIGKDYRDWVAVASSHLPKQPNWRLVKQVAECAAVHYEEPDWLNRLDKPELYAPGHVLAIAKVADVYQMRADNFPDSLLERQVGGWEIGRWAIRLEDAIAPPRPIPYNIPGQGAVYLTEEKHGIVYEQIIDLISES